MKMVKYNKLKAYIIAIKSSYSIENLVAEIHNLYQEYIISEAQELELYNLVDPEDQVDSPTPQGRKPLPLSGSVGRGRMPDLATYFISKTLYFAKIYNIMILVKKVRLVYATDNYSKTSDFS